MQRLPVGGLRHHPDLALFRVDGLAAAAPDLVELLTLLEQRRINLFFLAVSVQAGQTATSWCVATREVDRVKEAARRFPSLSQHLTILTPVCALSVYPHRNSPAPLCVLLTCLKETGVPILSLGTSISAVTCVLEEARAQEALTALEGAFELPQNHASIRLQLRHEPIVRGEEP